MNTLTNTTAALACCAVLLPAPATAADGEILIDQAAVNAGGITPGDTPGFPATISRPGRYKLTGNLNVPTGVDGIEVTVSDVSIDLNGFLLRSVPAGQARYGVRSHSGGNRLRVVNGTIKDFLTSGISYFGENGAFENLRILSSGEGLSAGINGRVRNNTIANNSFRGLGCSACVIEQNVVTGNGSGFGGALHAADGAVVVGNVIVANQGIGLWSTSGASSSSGYGNNILVGNNSGGAQVGGNLIKLHPNACEPACP